MKLSTRIVILSLVSSLIISVLLLVFNHQKRNILETTDYIIHSQELLKSSADLQKLVLDMETGLRGFLLTADAVYLEPYDSALIAYPATLARLEQIVDIQHPNRKHVAQITLTFGRWQERAHRIIEAKKIGENRYDGQGKIMIDSIRTSFAEIEKAESLMLAQTLAQQSNSISAYNRYFSILGISSIAFIALLSFVIIRSVSARVQNMVALSQAIAAGDLTANMANRGNDELSALTSALNTMAMRLKDAFNSRIAAEEEAIESEKRFRQIVEDASDIIYRTDEKGYFTYVNPIAERITGYSASTLLNMNFLQLIVPAQQEEVKSFYKHQAQIQDPFSYKEFQITTQDGRKIWVGQNVQLLFNKDQGKGFMAVARDITKLKEIEKELIHSRQLAEESVAAKELFLANMSHEIRTPMNAIIGFTELLSNAGLDKELQEYVKAIRISGDNLLVLVNEILDFSKIEAGKISFEKIAFSLTEVLHNMAKNFEQKSSEKEVALVINYEDDLPAQVIGDPYRLNQVLLNLVSNAFKFTTQGHVEVDIKCLDKSEQDALFLFRITDTGIGIPEESLKTIFENFTQANASTTRQYGGTGLGLSIVKNLVEMQGGTISVKSKVGAGSTFSFLLRYKLADVQQSHPAIQLPVTADFGGTLDVLVVEDNQLNQLLATKVLGMLNCVAHIAENGKVALQKISEKRFDIILMDIRMPEMDGFEATMHIRNHTDLAVRNTPIIAMTANAIEGELNKCLQVGMNDYISKPFKTTELISKLNTWTKANELASVEGALQDKNTKVYSNLAYLRMLCNNESDFMKDMITIYLTQATEFIDSMDKAFAYKDYPTLSALAHKMKSANLIVGIEALEEPMDKIEKYAVENFRLNEIPLLMDIVKDIVAQSVIELETELERL